MSYKIRSSINRRNRHGHMNVGQLSDKFDYFFQKGNCLHKLTRKAIETFKIVNHELFSEHISVCK